MDNKISNLPSIQETLKTNKVKINKSLGQNFLFDLNITDKIVKKSNSVASTIIEIGSGPGSLTRSILKIKSAIVFANRMLINVLPSFGSELERIIVLTSWEVVKNLIDV